MSGTGMRISVPARVGELGGDGLHRSVEERLVGATALRIDHPDGLHAHGEVVLDALLDVAHAVFAGEDLDAEQGRSEDDGFHRRGAADDADVMVIQRHPLK